ncbi:hypothetical protein [Streptomyces sp. NPDC050504]|uniref:hypothetical protein n=1 Tax=Streptomyces sp. NPDC050504 TaxID=3365618 RepID=UPI0037A1168B
MGNLWIGPPGGLYEIDQAAKSFDRSADLGVTEFKSLGGRVTVTRNTAPVRRTKLGWDLLRPADARALDRLARRVDGPGPLVLIDPVAGNVLSAAQAAGTGTAGQWFTTSATGSVTTAAGTFRLTTADATGQVAWRAAHWGNFPVAPGMRVSFHAPTAFAALPTVSVVLDFKDATGTYLASANGTGPAVTTTVPAGAVYVTPLARPGTAGTFALAGACLTHGAGAAPGIPGDGLPPMAVTGYSDAPGRPFPYRSLSIDLVEVAGAAE